MRVKLTEIINKPLSGEWGTDDTTKDGIPVLRTTNFTNSGIVNFDNVVLRIITKKNISEKYLIYGDILIEKSGGSDKQPVGRVIYFDGEEKKYLFNNFTSLLRVKDSEKWNSKYVFYSLYANYLRGGTLPYQNKTTGLLNLKLDQYLSDFSIVNISINDQNRIVMRLDLVRFIINMQQKEISKLDELIKSRFVEMFGDPIKNPLKWRRKQLNELTTKIGSGATPKGGRDSYCSKGTSLIRSMNVHNRLFEYKDLAHISDEQAVKLNNVTIQKNDVLLNITGASVARCCVVPDNALPARVNQHVCIIRCNDFLVPVFICEAFISDSFQNYLLEIAGSGATREAITKQQIERISMIVPPLSLQNQFADFVAKVEQQKATVQKSIEKLETLKKSLMQEYF